MADEGRLQGRVALITGGGRGIGRAIARAYAAEGAVLGLAARTESELQATADEIRAEFGSEVATAVTDVRDREQVEHTVAHTMERFGPIDVMVNNAGNTGEIGPLWKLDPERWANVISVHVLGTYYGCRAVIPGMLERGRGRIVNMSGVGGPNDTSYDAAKTAIVNMTENLSVELMGTGITVNAISPGSIHTRMWEEVRDMALAAGDMEMYEKGIQVTSGGGASIERAAELAVLLGSDACGGLSGRLIRAALDTFEDIPDRVDEIMSSDALLLRRVGLDG
ncbi:MAG: SDR family NAD(P)-dependent oxidoreductase [Chloroflexota bacterium]|nr:SDR family NAD(P)-dependent oxidoreductase [Chloroflexota bacterium]MDE2961333.1 SDR family NAD(P)-dependent oxidoreductase [Chloroflexota bacterium]